MKQIILTTDHLVKVSDEDYDYLNKFIWYLGARGYAIGYIENKKVYMASEIIKRMGLPKSVGQEIDHINRDKLDNQRENLRVVTNSLNKHNREPKFNKYGYRGICYDNRKNKWYARISIDKNTKFLGYFNTFEEAVKARKDAELRYLPEIYGVKNWAEK